MIVLDSSAWIEILRRSANGLRFMDAVTAASGVVVPTLCAYEVAEWMLRHEPDESSVSARIAALTEGNDVVPLDSSLALRSAQTSLTTGLAMADAIILTTARSRFATLWTQDEHFAGLDGVEYLPRDDTLSG